MRGAKRTAERRRVIGIAALIAGIALFALLLARVATREETQAAPGASEVSDVPRLANWTDTLPDGLLYAHPLPVTQFKTRDGELVSLDRGKNEPLLLLFWGSWCPHCDEVLSRSAQIADALDAFPQAKLVLIDKLDERRGETVERAQAHLEQLNVPFECLYDEGLRAYEAYGIRQIPTLLVLDADGLLRAMTTRIPASGEALSAWLFGALGGETATERFVRERLTDEDGGVYTSLVAAGGHPTGTDVLSESQGLMMTFALLRDDRALFERSYRAARERLSRDGVFCWYATGDGVQASANALLDDLRIYEALSQAEARWGVCKGEAQALARSIAEHNVRRGHLCGFYDFSLARAGDTLALFDIDLTALRRLAEDAPEAAAAVNEAERVLREGRINDAFPLYYASYDHQTKRYSGESLNTAEALMTLYHAVQAGIAGQDAIDWLRARVVSGTLAARYGVDGEPVRGFEYDSTAAYAIAALIGAAAGDARLYTAARNRMEKVHVTDEGALFGGFGDRTDGSDVIAFDQLLPLLVYAGARDISFGVVR